MSSSQKISQFNVLTTLLDTAQIVVVSGGQNYTIPFSTLKSVLGVTGTLEPTGDPLGVPILTEPVTGEYQVRGLESGNGISFSASVNNGVSASLALTQDATGTALVENLSTETPDVASLVAGDNVVISKTGQAITISADIEGIDAASAGDVFIADGVGSGTWVTAESISSGAAPAGAKLIADGAGGFEFARHEGWGQWQDTDTTVGAPSQTLTAGVRTLWTNDGGTSVVQKNPTDLILPFWNTSTNTIQPIAAFDVYHLRIGFIAENYAGATPYITVELDIGSPIGVITARDISLRKGGTAQEVSLAFPVYAGATFLANGGKVYLTYDGTGTCDIYQANVLIIRESKNFV